MYLVKLGIQEYIKYKYGYVLYIYQLFQLITYYVYLYLVLQFFI